MFLGYLIYAFPIAAVLSLIVIFALAMTDKILKRKKNAVRYVALYTFTGYLLSLLYLTVLWYYPDITFNPQYHFLNLKPFIWTSQIYAMGAGKMAEQLILNIGMFVPGGLLLAVVFKKLRNFLHNMLAVLAITVSIETLQYFIGRSCDIDDVIMNCIGGALGFLLFKLANRIFLQKEWWKKALCD